MLSSLETTMSINVFVGALGLSDRYVNGFLWLNKLGAAAAGGQSVVIRQTFYHGHYALIGEDLQPNPDFWISALYKKLVGRKVLKIQGHENTGNTLRLFAHCMKINPFPRPFTGIVVFGLNMANKTVEVPLHVSAIEEFKLSPDDGSLTSRKIRLNENVLNLDDGWKVPSLSGSVIKSGAPKLGAFEMAFWTFRGYSAAHACDNE